MSNKKEKTNRRVMDGFKLEDYKPINGRILITINSESDLLSEKSQSSILDYQTVVAVYDNEYIEVGDTVLIDIESLIQRFPEEGADGKTVIRESLKMPVISLDGKTYGEIRFLNLRGYFKKK